MNGNCSFGRRYNPSFDTNINKQPTRLSYRITIALITDSRHLSALKNLPPVTSTTIDVLPEPFFQLGFSGTPGLCCAVALSFFKMESSHSCASIAEAKLSLGAEALRRYSCYAQRDLFILQQQPACYHKPSFGVHHLSDGRSVYVLP